MISLPAREFLRLFRYYRTVFRNSAIAQQMQKLLICLACIASLQLVACSSSEQRDNTQKNSFLERIPIVHRPDIQQGNIVTQAMVDQLRPGMSKRQVRFVLGTPMLVDVFHQNRWDYMYTMTEGWGDTKKQRLSLYFEEDRLTRLEGDLRPSQAGILCKSWALSN